MITSGIDCGARNTKAVILKDGEIIGKAKVPTSFDLEAVAEGSLDNAHQNAGISKGDIQRIGNRLMRNTSARFQTPKVYSSYWTPITMCCLSEAPPICVRT